MKVSLSKMWRSGLALLLAICLVAGFVPGVAFAAPQDKYVAKVQDALDDVIDVIEKYTPDASKMAADVWADGYDEIVYDAIDALNVSLQERYEYYTGKQAVIDETITALTAQKDALAVELATLKAELAAKKAELAKIVADMEIGSIHKPEFSIGVGLGGNAQTQVPEYECTVDGEGVKAELEAAIRDLEHAIATVEALIADITADIDDMIELAKQIVNAVVELEMTISDIVAAVEEVNSTVAALKEVMNGEITAKAYKLARQAVLDAVAALEDVVAIGAEMAADIDDQIVILEDAAAKLYAKVMEDLPKEIQGVPMDPKVLIAGAVYLAKVKLEAELPGKIAEIKIEYADEIEQAKAELANLYAQIDAEVQAKYPAVEEAIKAEYAAKKAELLKAKDALEAEAKAVKAELDAKAAELAKATDEAVKTQLNAVIATLQAQYDRLAKDIATVNADLECMTEHLDAALKAAHDQIVAEVTAAYEKALAELKQAVADLKAAMNKAIADLEAAVDAQVKALEAELAKLQKKLTDAINGVLNGIKNKIETELKGLANAIEALKNALVEAGINSIEELVDALIKACEDMLYAATHADLVIDYDFKYVALGDGSAVADGYAEALAETLNAEAAENGIKKGITFVNEAKAGNTVAAEAANLSAEVADADLITLGFSQAEMMGQALKTMINQEKVDWAALLGEEAVPYVEQALEKVYAEVDKAVENEQIAEMVKGVLEAYAYGAVEYAVQMPALLQGIRAVNKDAIVMVVGMYNPLDGVSIAGFDLSQFNEYFDYLVDGVAVYGIGLAMLTNQVDYVDARDVAVAQPTLGLMDMVALLDGDVSALYPSAAGHDYIAAQLADALNLSFAGLLGDVDGNGKVNGFDLLRLKKYLSGEDVEIVRGNADTTKDGKINGFDLLKLKKYLSAPELYPL